jgi:hypothetical protein
MAMDHTNCTHPRTPAGRRACRATNNSVVGLSYVPIPEDFPGTDRAFRKANPGRPVTLAEAIPNRRRQRFSEAARIQPRRSGARVSATGSTCVQAALHIDAHGGRCACGWVAA